MSLMSEVDDNDDNLSISPSTDSDDDISKSHCHTHRSCSFNGLCSRKKHQNAVNGLSTNLKPTKGDIRYINNESEHRQKYDGNRWRRICCTPNCSTFLNGGIYYDRWLCRRHYLLTMATDNSTESDIEKVQPKETGRLKNTVSQRTSARYSNKKTEQYQRGDILTNTDGTRLKYDGQSWRAVCHYDYCRSFVVAHGYCRRHDIEIRKKNSELSRATNIIQRRRNSVSKSLPKRSIRSDMKKLKKGDIRLVRQQWNGTKWYSLCRYQDGNCQRRSIGLKSAYLCDIHYREYRNQQKNQDLIDRNNQISLSSIVKPKTTINNNGMILSSHIIDTPSSIISYRSASASDQIQPVEQSTQTDVTYPIDSIDLRQGCFLIEDDNNDAYQCDSPQLMVYIKKEEEDYLTDKRKPPTDIDSLPMNCKSELTKLEV